MTEAPRACAVAKAVRRAQSIATAHRLTAGPIGTVWLVLGGCNAAMLAAGTTISSSIGQVGVALGFGLTVFTMAFAVGFISSRHSDPAVSVGLTIAEQFPARDLLGYALAHLIGGIIASAAFAMLKPVTSGFNLVGSGFAANGHGARLPSGSSVATVFLAGAILTIGFLTVILGTTDNCSPAAGGRA